MSAIDYDRMNRVRRGQKSALTRAIKSRDPLRILKVCRDAVREWDAIGAWPDDWHRWQIALNDARPLHRPVSLEDLR